MASTHDTVQHRPPMPPPKPASYSSPKTKATVATTLFVVLGVATLITIIATAHQTNLIRELTDGRDVSNQQLLTSDTLLTFISNIYIGTFMAAALTFLVWLHTASKNLAALGTEHQEFTPFKAILWWFIPIAWIIFPFWVVKEIWHESHPNPSKPAPAVLFGLWWLTWLTSGFATAVLSFFPDSPSLSQLHSQNIITITADVLSLISLVLVIIIIRRITSNQELKHSQLAPRH